MGISCPICKKDCTSDDHARRHLHVHHRKSELLDILLEDSAVTGSEREPVTISG